MTERVPSRRDILAGLGAAGATIIATSAEVAAADRRIQQLEGFRSDPVAEAVLFVHNKALEKLVLSYIAAFESAGLRSQEAMNANPALQSIQRQIDATLADPAFKMALLVHLQRTLPKSDQRDIVGDSIAKKDTSYTVSATFYYSAAGRLGFGIDVNGLWATGG